TATKKIRENERLNLVPVIAFTASVMRDDILKINDAFDDYLQKPINSEMLEIILLHYLKYEETVIENAIQNINTGKNESKDFNILIDLKNILTPDLKFTLGNLLNVLEIDKIYKLCD